jgi:predicted PurR-regulated permease PerM
MASRSIASLQRAYYSVALLIIVVVMLFYARVVFVPLALAILLAFMLTSPVAWLESRGLPRTPSVLLVAVVAFVLLGLILWIVSVEVSHLASQWPEHREDINRKLTGVQHLLERVRDVSHLGSPARVGHAAPAPGHAAPIVVESGGGASLVSWIPSIAQPLLDILARVLLVIVLTVFMLSRRENLRDRLLLLIGQGHLTSATKAVDEATERVSRYLVNQLATNTFVGIGVAAGLYWVGVPYALLWGSLTIALRFIPYVGVWGAALLPFIVSVAFFPGWQQALAVVGIYVFLELITANIIEPLLFSHSTGVSPIALLVAAVFWAWLWGPVGLLMSTPLTVCLVVLGKRIPALEFLDVLLGEPPPLDPAARYYQRLVARDEKEAAELVREYVQTHSREAVFDEVLVPALVFAKRDRRRKELTPDDARFVFRATRHMFDGTASTGERGEGPPCPSGEAPATARCTVIGTPAQGEVDEMALHLLQHLLRPLGFEVQIVSARSLEERIAALVDQSGAAVVCIAALPPSGLARARNLCRQIRGKVPQVKVLVGRWGQKEDLDRIRDSLRAAGADEVGATLVDTRDQLLALTPDVASPPTRGAEPPRPEGERQAAEPVERAQIPSVK